MDVLKHMGTVVGRRFPLRAGWGAEGCEVSWGARLCTLTASGCKEGPLHAPPLGQGDLPYIPALHITEPQQEVLVMCLPLIFSSGDPGWHEILYKKDQLSHLLSPALQVLATWPQVTMPPC